ncbi:MAG: hypothetical protein QG602_82 [Verrucomicrobiota bacterium]|nr:hypothetical protein [Verrucomicrobiota bacterium]
MVMKASRFFISTRTATLLAALLLSALTLSAKEEVHLDFTHITRDSPEGPAFKAYQFTYGDWGNGKVIDLKGRGALIQAPGGKGGLGENSTMLKLHKTPVIDLHFVIGNNNQAGSLNFSLTDRDGTEQSWSVPLSGLAKGADQRLRLDLTKPGSEQKPGKKPGMDLAKLSSWQVRGDWGAAAVEVLLVKVVSVKE